MSKPIGVAVLGLGNVGSEVVRIIEESATWNCVVSVCGASPPTAAYPSRCSPRTSAHW
jgi:homoserine dehydrogenase